MSNMVELTSANFAQTVAKGVWLVDFWGEHCMPCLKMAELLDKLAPQYAGRLAMGKFNIHSDINFAIERKIGSIPTIFIMKDGVELKRFVGLTTQGKLTETLDAVLAEAGAQSEALQEETRAMTPKVVAVVGATGLVGNRMLRMLEERNFPVKQIKMLASERSLGKTLTFKGEDVPVEVLTETSFKGVDIALFSAGGGTSKKFATFAAQDGCVVIDNSSAWRMDPEVPLVVPEVNAEEIKAHKGIIANPNCSTIQMVVVLKPLHDAAKIERVVVSTYQAVSGAGIKALNEMQEQMKAVLENRPAECKVFPHQIAFNCIPQIPQSDAFTENGYTSEEMKMVNETKKIMGDDSIRVTATTVRVPVHTGHSECVNIETQHKLTADQAREILRNAPGIVVLDDPANQVYPLATDAAGKGETFVGRIREDISQSRGLDMWIVSDNLLKGAALNAVQIAELL